jgi:hypothetical protein
MLNMKEVIKSVSYNQSEILYNIKKLYNNGNDYECDPTFSIGNFYSKSRTYPVAPPQYKFDVNPIVDGVNKIELFGVLPLDDCTIQSIVIDLPFVVSSGKSLTAPNEKSVIISNRFSCYHSVNDMLKSYRHFISEAFRILKYGGICVVKTQRTINSKKTIMTPEIAWKFAEKKGFETLDRFTLISKKRLLSGKVKHQEHSRSFDSQFYVFKKKKAKATYKSNKDKGKYKGKALSTFIYITQDNKVYSINDINSMSTYKDVSKYIKKNNIKKVKIK